jgi:hypothetical protein
MLTLIRYKISKGTGHKRFPQLTWFGPFIRSIWFSRILVFQVKRQLHFLLTVIRRLFFVYLRLAYKLRTAIYLEIHPSMWRFCIENASIKQELPTARFL